MNIFELLREPDDGEPLVDIAICSVCGWRGPVEECPKEKEGDYESGYNIVDLCPACEDGGCIDDYDMSPKREAEWAVWNKKQDEENDRQRG